MGQFCDLFKWSETYNKPRALVTLQRPFGNDPRTTLFRISEGSNSIRGLRAFFRRTQWNFPVANFWASPRLLPPLHPCRALLSRNPIQTGPCASWLVSRPEE